MGLSQNNLFRLISASRLNSQLFNFKKGSLFSLKKLDEPGKLFDFQKKVTSAVSEVPVAPAESESFLNIFEEAKKSESKETVSDNLMEGIVKNEESGTESLLGPLPKIDTNLFIDEEYHAKRKMSFAKGAFATSFILLLVTFGYFHIKLSPTFDLFSSYIGNNTEQDLHAKTDRLKSLQTQLNADRYRIIKAHLDNFTYYADEFLKKYDESLTTKDEQKQQNLEESLVGLRGKLKEDFNAIKDKLKKTSYVTIYREKEISPEESTAEFNELLQQYFLSEKTEIASKESDIAKAKAKEINEMIALIGNVKFEKIFEKYDFDALTNESIKEVVQKINGVIKNELSILHQIKDTKIRWADVIHEIENITIQVDDLYGSGYFDELGGIVYTSYDFNAASKRISITGQTKRDDATNFTLIANLIDKLESSSMFTDVNMRSFTKSGSLENGYIATLQLDFFLQNDLTTETQ